MLGFCFTFPQKVASIAGLTIRNFNSWKLIQLKRRSRVTYVISISTIKSYVTILECFSS